MNRIPSSQASLAGFSETNDAAGFQNTRIDLPIQHDYYFSVSIAILPEIRQSSSSGLTGVYTALARMFGISAD